VIVVVAIADLLIRLGVHSFVSRKQIRDRRDKARKESRIHLAVGIAVLMGAGVAISLPEYKQGLGASLRPQLGGLGQIAMLAFLAAIGIAAVAAARAASSTPEEEASFAFLRSPTWAMITLASFTVCNSLALALAGPTKFSNAVIFEPNGGCVAGPLLAQDGDRVYLADGRLHAVVSIDASDVADLRLGRAESVVTKSRVRKIVCPSRF
jgi:hypothetical protein